MTRSRDEDTIVAPATAPGRAALAIIRVSGSVARKILGEVFRPSVSARISARRPLLGVFLDREGSAIDQGIAVFYSGPKSYTGEDMLELMPHGSPATVGELIHSCVCHGARPAEPGEFSLRALRHGKLDLTQAEAVRDLVDAASVEQARIAARQLAGEVSQALLPIAERALDLLSDVEAGLDFADEEQVLLEPVTETAQRCARIARDLDGLLDSSRLARRVREGARVVLLGPTNSGKSSLFNNLVGSARMIVTAEPGTTRDIVEETIVVEGLPVILVDGAGIGETSSRAEQIGAHRALEAAGQADLVLEVYDLTSADRADGPASRERLRVGTHADERPAAPPAVGTILVSNVTGQGIDDLRREIGRVLGAPGRRPIETVALATERHRHAAKTARDHLREARRVLIDSGASELAAVELRAAVASVREILGHVGPEELLGRIFSRFCIGK